MSVSGVHTGMTGMHSLWYQSSIYAPQHTVAIAPVEPVGKAPVVEKGSKAKVYAAAQPVEPQLPAIRQGADPVEMAVRGRIQYLNEDELNGLMNKVAGGGEAAMKLPAEEAAEVDKAASAVEQAEGNESAEETESPAEVMEEGECQTCKERKYQDGSNDPGVSFKTPTNIAPEQAATAVRGHEMEHVVREQAKAEREDRQVVQQSVTLHNEICPECGDVYISGGTTRTVTRANSAEDAQNQKNQQDPQGAALGFNAVA